MQIVILYPVCKQHISSDYCINRHTHTQPHMDTLLTLSEETLDWLTYLRLVDTRTLTQQTINTLSLNFMIELYSQIKHKLLSQLCPGQRVIRAYRNNFEIVFNKAACKSGLAVWRIVSASCWWYVSWTVAKSSQSAQSLRFI